ncbi:hypothetical protein PISMIDRAFT_688457 [Pisolithus microcarpus 441]|uniref:Unplaced genomic scaffold scaffold_295, whole genome shotgun sequence n=1 Tax=Pisolithus microcarpus 441 TaxID=765257 RepID=A0A0C9Y9X2_9AGAM|nr:hypothetical protein BKA83DRAFT_688457 [Pisolithus microcarpus]KIK13696.1 hypothetical protein PISMIDRAFT_688457 [Pisolithus microcarpus 441]
MFKYVYVTHPDSKYNDIHTVTGKRDIRLRSEDLVVTDILGIEKGIEALVETDSSKKLNRANPNRTDLQTPSAHLQLFMIFLYSSTTLMYTHTLHILRHSRRCPAYVTSLQ